MLIRGGRLVTVGTLKLRIDNFPKYLVVNIDQLLELLILIDLRLYPPFITTQRSFNRIASTANFPGDMTGLKKIGNDKEDLFARIVAASITR